MKANPVGDSINVWFVWVPYTHTTPKETAHSWMLYLSNRNDGSNMTLFMNSHSSNIYTAVQQLI